MTYQVLPVDIVGESYKSRSLPLSAQTSINLVPEANRSGRTPTALQNFYGSKPWLAASGKNRGMAKFKNELYKVSGNKLYKISSIKTVTEIGDVLGSDRCILLGDGSNLTILTGTTVYQYDGSTLSINANTDLEDPKTGTVINNQIVFQGFNGRWVVASPGDPDDVPAVNYAIAESNGDDLVAVYEFNETLYLMGTDTIESWFNSGSGSPPMTRIQGGLIKKGVCAPYSVANTAEFVYFLDSDKKVSRITGYQIDETVTPVALAHEFFKLNHEDAHGLVMNIDGQNLYVIMFPLSDKTYAYSETFNTWTQLSYGVDGGRHLIDDYLLIYSKRLIADYRNGNVYELDDSTFTDNGDVQIRERTTSPINGITLGLPTGKLQMEWFELLIETGVGLATGQGSAPEIMFFTSVDGGRIFDQSGVGYVSMGESGNYLIRVRFDCVIEFTDLIIKVRISDPVFVSIHGAAISVEAQGGY